MPPTNPNLSPAMQEAYASSPTNVKILHTMELTHPAFEAPIRVVRNYPDLKTWLALDAPAVQPVLATLDDDALDLVGLVARLEAGAPYNGGEMVVWTALAFQFELPPDNTDPVPEISVSLDNVDRKITDALIDAATSQKPTMLTYRPYHSDDISGPQLINPYTFTLSEVSASPTQVTGRASISNFGIKAFPGRRYTTDWLPSSAV